MAWVTSIFLQPQDFSVLLKNVTFSLLFVTILHVPDFSLALFLRLTHLVLCSHKNAKGYIQIFAEAVMTGNNLVYYPIYHI